MRKLFALAALVTATQASPQCNDECANAITGIGTIPIPLPSRTFDCSVFLETTTTLPLNTIYITTSIDLDNYGLHDFGPTPVPSYHSVPSYASGYCTDSAAYSHACSCLGITASTVTAPAPTVALYDELPNCVNPGTCTPQGYNNAICGNGGGICIADAGGLGWCMQDVTCGDGCANNGECMSGVCLVNSCCGGGTCYDPGLSTLVERWVGGEANKMKLKRWRGRTTGSVGGEEKSGLGNMLGPPYTPVGV